MGFWGFGVLLLLLLDFEHDGMNLLGILFESFKEYLQSMHYDVSCFKHFRFNLPPFRIKAAEYREQFNQVERIIDAFFRSFIVDEEISGVSAFPADLVDFRRVFVQEIWNLLRRGVYHLHDLPLLIK